MSLVEECDVSDKLQNVCRQYDRWCLPTSPF